MNIILTGIARSGTTLTCSLLNNLPQCVALHEPMNPSELASVPFPSGYIERVSAFYDEQRSSLMDYGRALSKARDGNIPDNPFETPAHNERLRPSTVHNQEVLFDKKLMEGFRLVVKHPNLFTATLAVLKEVYPCFAIVRNPLAVLLSWHTIEAPVNKGRLPYGEAFDESLKSALLSESNVIERQIIILNWYFSQYESHLPSENIIKYEDLISSGGRVLCVIDKDASMLNVPLNSRNTSSIYDKELVRGFASRLLDEKSTINNFYKHEEIEDLLKKWTKQN